MKLKQLFRDIEKGDKCTGTVLRFNLNGPQLVRQEVLAVENGDYILVNREPLPSRPQNEVE